MQKLGRYFNRMDRLCGDMNVVLLVIAIGLATLDFTCFFCMKMSDEIAKAKQSGFITIVHYQMTDYPTPMY